MKKYFKHTTGFILERHDQDYVVDVEIDWFWDDGESLTPESPAVGRGWWAEIVARDPESGAVIELTDREQEIIREENHPDSIERGEDRE